MSYGSGNITALFGGTPFDPNAVEPSKDYEVLPPGKYPCLVEDCELKTTQAGNGQYIKVTLKVVEGPHANRKIFDNINVLNPNEDCQRMGIAQLSAIGRAAACYPVNDTADLIDKVVIAVVKVKKRKDTGEEQNDVRTYEHPSLASNAQYAPAPPPVTVAPAISNPTPAAVPAPQPAAYAPAPAPAATPAYAPPAPAPQAAPVATAPAPQPAYVPPNAPAAVPAAAGPGGDAPWKR